MTGKILFNRHIMIFIKREEIQDTKEIKMEPITLAQEIIDGRRITRMMTYHFSLHAIWMSYVRAQI